jgi:mannose-6-phosphate isomerase-like protein (cupin superfamily)
MPVKRVESLRGDSKTPEDYPMIDKQTAKHYSWGDHCDGWHLVRDPSLSVIHERMPPNTAELRHFHQRARQFFFMLSGCATFEIAGEMHTLNPHQGIEVPPGISHRIRNTSAEPIEFLVISQPPSHGDRIVEG